MGATNCLVWSPSSRVGANTSKRARGVPPSTEPSGTKAPLGFRHRVLDAKATWHGADVRVAREGRMNTNSLAQLMRVVRTESTDGAKLLENPTDNPICSLSYDETIRCVTIVWRRLATSAQFRSSTKPSSVCSRNTRPTKSSAMIRICRSSTRKTKDGSSKTGCRGRRRRALRPPQPTSHARFLVSCLSRVFTPN